MRFNPRTPCGVRRIVGSVAMQGDAFQSTHSLRSATSSHKGVGYRRTVSIHALLAECDKIILLEISSMACFNPRTPCGVRLLEGMNCKSSLRFQSTHSLRSATLYRTVRPAVEAVSIHALLAECDMFPPAFPVSGSSFNPRTPCGVRQGLTPAYRDKTLFQSTHSLRSATKFQALYRSRERVSIHALLAECDF